MYHDHAYVNDRHLLKTVDDLGTLADQLAAKQPINAERLYDLVLALRKAVEAPAVGDGRSEPMPPPSHDLAAVLSDATYLYGTGRVDAASIIVRAIRSMQSLVERRNAALAYATGRAMIDAKRTVDAPM